jgi:NAD(P)-dependent dehydrogenase (short-subunit alcohol dehydrogenase family)
VECRALKLDLSSQNSVRKAAAEVLEWDDVPTIDLLINSAGVMLVPERTLSEDGIELHFATNHIGHFLFTSLIMSKLIRAAQDKPKGSVRVVNLSSSSPTGAGIRWHDINFDKVNKTLPLDEQPAYNALKAWGTADPEEQSYIPREGYNQSKVANALFSIALNNKLYDQYGVLSLAVNPGVIATELNRNSPPEVVAAIKSWGESGRIHIKSLNAGAATTLVAATDPQLGRPTSKDGKENYGAYLADCQISDQANPTSRSNSNADRLWALSEELVKQKFAW